MSSFFVAQEAADHVGEPAAAGSAHGAEHGGSHASDGSISIGEHWQHDVGFGMVNVDTLLYTGIVMLLLLVAFAVLGKTVSRTPRQESGPVGTVVEGVVDFCQKIIHDFIGPRTAPYLWLIGSIFVFILFANWLSLLPWRAWELTVGQGLASLVGAPHSIRYEAPTADLNTTAALGLVSLVVYWIFGVKHGGLLGFVKHHWFAKPVFLFPLRMLEDVTRPVSLALRLFANMTAGHVVGLVLLSLTFFVVPAVMLPMELFIGAVQAFIFAALTASYIGAAVAEDHH